MISALNPDTGAKLRLHYDSETSRLVDDAGRSVCVEPLARRMDYADVPDAPRVSKERPGRKTADPSVLKIQMGLTCNFACEYCMQRFVPHAEEVPPAQVSTFMGKLLEWYMGGENGDGSGLTVEFWGGEPFLYWGIMRPLAEALRAEFPKIAFLVVTNGSLLDRNRVDWLHDLGFMVAISHDGPGQAVRGPDPLADAKPRDTILYAYERLRPHRITFNPMMNRVNRSRAACQEFFRVLTGDERVRIGEGSFIAAYDEGGAGLSQLTPEEWKAYARDAFEEIDSGRNQCFTIVSERVSEWVDSWANQRPARCVGQICGMDLPDRLTVDLEGRVLTCQNLSAKAVAPNGESHHIGDMSRLDDVRLTTASSWTERAHCSNCPMLQTCQGSCMFLEGDLWTTSCDNSYYDHLATFAVAVKGVTGGFMPYYIEGPLPAERKDIFGMVARGEVEPLTERDGF